MGSRHLQALALVNEALSIHVVEPSTESTNRAKERYASELAKAAHQVHFYSSLSSLPKGLSVAIVATNADCRAEVVRELLKTTKVDYLVLEKILFTQLSDYEQIEELCRASVTRTWVNCCMRQMPFFQDLRKSLKGQKVQFQAFGGRYGLITNAIHHVDYMAYVCDDLHFELSTEFLEKDLVESKRRGFFEMSGMLVAQFSKGSRATMTCFQESEIPILVELQSERKRFLIREPERKLWEASEEQNWQWSERDIEIPRQSRLTNLLVEDLLREGECSLTPLRESALIHLQLLKPLYTKLASLGLTKANAFT